MADENITHNGFIITAYVVGLLLLLFGNLQWILASRSTAVVVWCTQYNFLSMFMLAWTYILMLIFTFYFAYLNRTSKALVWIFVFVTIELATAVLVRPMTEAILHDFVFATVTSTFVFVLTYVVAQVKKRDALLLNQKQLIVWTLRFYLLTSIGLVMALAARLKWIELTFTTLTNFVLLAFNIVFGRSLSCSELFQTEKANAILYAVLIYHIFVAFYANALLISRDIRFYMDDEPVNPRNTI